MVVPIQICPECESELPADAATRGLCPRCLIRRALAGIEETAAFGQGEGQSTPATRFAAPEVSELVARFEAFEILELLGQGGMGAVYMARQKSLQRLIALKVIPRELAADPAFVERFHREARTLARLNHPHIVTAYDFGQVDDLCFLVMEYVGGPNLRRRMGQGRLTPAEAIRIALQVCDALEYAHGQGVVHRDIKPENILLESPPDGEAPAAAVVKIADFGLVRILEPAKADFTLTTADHILGTPQYMAPEQIERPGQIDHRVDIYALGAVLYEMLTGELPLGRFDPPAQRIVWQSTGGGEPCEGRRPADAPPWCERLDAIVLRCLEKDPQRRYAEAAQLGRELRDVIAWFEDPASAPVAPEPEPELASGTRRWSAVSVATLLLALAMVVDLGWQIGERIWGQRSDATNPTATVAPEKPAEPSESAGPVVETPPRRPLSFQATVKPDRHRAPFDSIRLTGGSLKGDGVQYSMAIEFGRSMFTASPTADCYWIIESDSGWSEPKRISWYDLRNDGALRHTFSPPDGDRGPWETWLETQSIGPGTARKRMSNVIRFEQQTSNGEE